LCPCETTGCCASVPASAGIVRKPERSVSATLSAARIQNAECKRVGEVFYNANPNRLTILRRVQKDAAPAYRMDDLSDECIAWLKIDNTDINYPIMQADNNNKYLNLAPTGEYSLSGSIFLDFRNSPDFSDSYSLIYGHHMANNYMFGALDKFAEFSYLMEHRTGTLELRNGKTLGVNIFAYDVVEAEEDSVFKPGYLQNVQTYIDYHSVSMLNHGNGNLLALTTCRSTGDTSRTIVFCELTEELPEDDPVQ